MLTIVCRLIVSIRIKFWQVVLYSIRKKFTMQKEILIKFGSKVKEFRLDRNLSQEELAYKANLHRTYIGMIERGEKNITLLNIEKIAKALAINIHELFQNIGE